jgi:hypothetical protein
VIAHPTARARLEQSILLLGQAHDSIDEDWETFKALVAATIVMGRSTLHMVQSQDNSKPGFKHWFSGLEAQFPTLKFFRDERDALLKERMVALHGLGYRDVGTRFVLKAEGEELPPPATAATTEARRLGGASFNPFSRKPSIGMPSVNRGA